MFQHFTQPMNTRRPIHSALVLILFGMLGGCASKAPQGYGMADDNMAAQAQRQMEKAEQSTQIDPQQTYLNLIAQMQQANQWFASLAHTDAFEKQYGSNAQIRLLRADALRNTGQVPAAEQAYLALLKESTGNIASRARRGLGLLYAAQGRFSQAVAQLEQARQLNPIDADVLSDLAYAQMLDGRLTAAAVPIQQAAQLAPTNTRVQLNLALYWLASGAQSQATMLLERLRQPQAKNAAPPIDDHTLQGLHAQLQTIQQAVRTRADAAAQTAESATTPPAIQAVPKPATPASTDRPRTIVIGSLPPATAAEPETASAATTRP